MADATTSRLVGNVRLDQAHDKLADASSQLSRYSIHAQGTIQSNNSQSQQQPQPQQLGSQIGSQRSHSNSRSCGHSQSNSQSHSQSYSQSSHVSLEVEEIQKSNGYDLEGHTQEVSASCFLA